MHVLPVCSCPRSAEILSHAVFLVFSEVCYIRPLSPSLYLSVLSLCRCGRTDCCSVTSTALAFQQRRIRWKFHISLSLSLGCDTFSSSIPDTDDIRSPSFSQSLHLILSVSLFLSPVSHFLP